jgi:hypothetical protein
MLALMVPRSGEDDVASGEVFPSVKNQGIEPEGGPRNTTCSTPAHKKTNLHTQHNQAAFISHDLALVSGGAIGVLMKSSLLGFQKSHNLVFS